MITIRARAPKDEPSLVALWERSVCATHHFLRPSEIDALRSLIAQCYLPALEIWLAQRADHQPCGFIGLTASHVEMLFIDAPARGNGIGRRLIDHAVALRVAAPRQTWRYQLLAAHPLPYPLYSTPITEPLWAFAPTTDTPKT